MHGAQCLRGALAVHDHGDIALRSTLSNGAHADRRVAQRIEHLGGHAVSAGHSVADDRQDAQSQAHVDALNLAVAQFRVECPAHRGLRAGGLRLGNGEAYRMFGAALGNQYDRNACVAQCAEQAMSGAGHADHPGAFQIHQCHRIDGGDALDHERRNRLGANQRAALFRGKCVLDVDGDVASHGRLHGLRMNHLGAEVSQLHRLVIGELIDDLSVGNEARIGRQHSIHVGPNDDFRRLQQRAEYRPGKIAAVASERGLHPAGGRCDEAGHDQSAREVRRHQPLEVLFARGPLHRGTQGSPFDDDHFPGIDPLHGAGNSAPLAQKGAKRRVDQISP